jgi:hypothetical protein
MVEFVIALNPDCPQLADTPLLSYSEQYSGDVFVQHRAGDSAVASLTDWHATRNTTRLHLVVTMEKQ